MFDYSSLGRILVIVGIILLVLGGVLMGAGKFFNIGKLPGDIIIKRGSVTIFFPIVTFIILSILATIVLNVLFRK